MYCFTSLLITVLFSIVLTHPVEGTPHSPFTPDGYLLVLKAVRQNIGMDDYTNYAVMYRLDFSGKVTLLWNISFLDVNADVSWGAFAYDENTDRVYLPVVDRIVGISNKHGKMEVKISLESENSQYFWTYDYDTNSNSLIGVCSDDGLLKWDWCQMSIGRNDADLTRVVSLPYIQGANGLDQYAALYNVDPRDQIIWYKPYIKNFVVATNYSTGEAIYISGFVALSCITYNPLSNRTYVLTGEQSLYQNLSVAEVQPKPKPLKTLLKLPGDLILSTFGSCGMIAVDNIMYVVMWNVSKYAENFMPTDLILIDLTTHRYVQIPIETEKWLSEIIMTGVRYIPR